MHLIIFFLVLTLTYLKYKLCQILCYFTLDKLYTPHTNIIWRKRNLLLPDMHEAGQRGRQNCKFEILFWFWMRPQWSSNSTNNFRFFFVPHFFISTFLMRANRWLLHRAKKGILFELVCASYIYTNAEFKIKLGNLLALGHGMHAKTAWRGVRISIGKDRRMPTSSP